VIKPSSYEPGSVIPVVWLRCAVFKVRREALARAVGAKIPRGLFAPADAGLSKLDSMQRRP